MEHYGVPNRIQVSEATYKLLKDEYEFEVREPIDVKGKGIVQTFFLLSKKPQTATQTEPATS
jgi:guanylate cyclase